MKKNALRACCLLLSCMLLAGCQSREGAVVSQVTLPPAAVRFEAPEHDANQEYEQTVMLYLPSVDGSQLLAVPQTATFSAVHHSAAALCEMLFTHPGNEMTVPMYAGTSLSLSETDAVEVSGQVATVNLAASALRLNHEQLFTVSQAIANTLCQFGDLQYVNVLISGAQPGMNIAATLPAGSYQMNNREDLGTLWARASAPLNQNKRSFAVTLYFPGPSGKGILCEDRMVAFSAQDVPGMAVTLLDALSAGAEQLPGVPRCPELRSLLREMPTVEETGGNRRLVLRFTDRLNGALIDAGITRSVMMASLVYTLTTFLPGIAGVEVRIGDERVNAITPSGTYSGAGEMISFTDGLMRRRDFSSFLLAECALYFANGSGKLQKVYRPVPFNEANNARALLEQLMLGPQPFDSETGLLPVLPEGLRPADLLGVGFDQNVMLLNFSSQFSALSQGMASDAEKREIYALVNTLCELPEVKRVCFFIQGQQPETLAGNVYLPGDFLPNWDLNEQ